MRHRRAFYYGSKRLVTVTRKNPCWPRMKSAVRMSLADGMGADYLPAVGSPRRSMSDDWQRNLIEDD